MSLTKCAACGIQISVKARACPKCGEPRCVQDLWGPIDRHPLTKDLPWPVKMVLSAIMGIGIVVIVILLATGFKGI